MTKIKICGIKRLEDIEYVNIAKPDYIGFVFAKSKRQIDIKTAKVLKEKLDKNILAVGVFVNEDIKTILDIVKENIIDLIQLHGNEDDDYILKLKEETTLPIIKAYRDSNYSDYSLFDNKNPGSGEIFDWNSINTTKNYFLAGGIDSTNIKDALKLNPFAVDLSSSVETDGVKDLNKIMEIVRLVRNER